MVFWKLFWRKNNDNYNEDLLDQKRKEVQEEIEAYKKNSDKELEIYKENIHKETNKKIEQIIEKASESFIEDIEKVLTKFREQKEKINNFSDKEISLQRLEKNKKSAISILNYFINNYEKNYRNIENKHYKNVLEAYNNAIKEIENS